jgi:phosphatidylethanolamine-binding protein (PEBP) family uncharacterized protein
VLAGCGFFGDDVTSGADRTGDVDADQSGVRGRGHGATALHVHRSQRVTSAAVDRCARRRGLSLALVVTDPDAPGGHVRALDRVQPGQGDPVAGRWRAAGRGAAGAQQQGHAAYDGPCPPNGTHHYRFTIYALRSATTLDNGIDTTRALDAIDGKAIGRGTLVGTVTAG